MPARLSLPYCKLLEKKQNIFRDLYRALSFQNKALEERNEEGIVLYSEYIESRRDEILTIDRVLSGVKEDVPGDLSPLEDELTVLKEKILELYGSNISLIRESMKEIERQILSVKLLKKRNTLYNPVSKSERIDITR